MYTSLYLLTILSNPYFIMTLGGLLGIGLHGMKNIQGINKRLDQATFRMVFIEYWKSEFVSITMSFLAFLTLLYVASEFIDLNHVEEHDMKQPLADRLMHFKIANFIRATSVIAGYFSDSIVYGFMGVTEIKLKKKLKTLEDDANKAEPKD